MNAGCTFACSTARSQSLTEAGQAFYEHCQRASAELLAGRALLESGQKTVTGRLRVSLPVLFGRLCAAPVLLRLTESQPELALDLEFSDRSVELVADGYDLAVRMGPLGDSPGLTVRRVASERMSIFAGPAYLERHSHPSCLADLTQHQTIAYGWRGRVQAWLIPGQASEPQTIYPPTRLCFNDLGAIVDDELLTAIRQLTDARPTYGYRRITRCSTARAAPQVLSQSTTSGPARGATCGSVQQRRVELI